MTLTSTADVPLPDPCAGQTLSARSAFLVAEEAAWHTRRLVDASRCIVTGNLAMFCCLPATLMVWWDVAPDGDWARVMGAAVMVGFAGWAVLSSLWLGRLRSSGEVKFTDRFEANLSTIRKSPFRGLAPSFSLVFGAFAAWSYLFKVMPSMGIAVIMWMVVIVIAGIFAGRFLRYHFWEDVLFMASVVAAWSLYLLQSRLLAPLAIVPPLAVIVGTVCLYRRWRHWLGSLPVSGATPTPPEAG